MSLVPQWWFYFSISQVAQRFTFVQKIHQIIQLLHLSNVQHVDRGQQCILTTWWMSIATKARCCRRALYYTDHFVQTYGKRCYVESVYKDDLTYQLFLRSTTHRNTSIRIIWWFTPWMVILSIHGRKSNLICSLIIVKRFSVRWFINSLKYLTIFSCILYRCCRKNRTCEKGNIFNKNKTH